MSRPTVAKNKKTWFANTGTNTCIGLAEGLLGSHNRLTACTDTLDWLLTVEQFLNKGFSS